MYFYIDLFAYHHNRVLSSIQSAITFSSNFGVELDHEITLQSINPLVYLKWKQKEEENTLSFDHILLLSVLSYFVNQYFGWIPDSGRRII